MSKPIRVALSGSGTKLGAHIGALQAITDAGYTIVELAGGSWPPSVAGKPVPTPPGKSLVPAFTKDGSVQHDYFWWHHIGNRAIRVGDWKLVAAIQSPWELYNLATDRAESHDLAASQPDKVHQLEKMYNDHLEEFRRVATQDLPAGRAQAKIKPDPVD